MTQLHERVLRLSKTKSCSEYADYVQAEGLIHDEPFSLEKFELILSQIQFKMFSVGDPKVLICKRADCLLLVKSDGSFNISQVKNDEILSKIIQEIEINIQQDIQL